MPEHSGPSLRPYRPADLDAVIAVFQGAVREVASKDYDRAQIDAWAEVDHAAWATRRSRRPTWVAVLNEAVIGFADLEPDGHLEMMFVHPAYQGIGVASRLLEAIEAAAAAEGISRLFTEASLTARPFFERRGFQLLARQRIVLRGQSFVNFRMQNVIGQGS